MEGWFKINRKLLDDSLWLCEPFSRGQAWVDLIGLASHKANFFYKRGVKINLDRGQVGVSEIGLSDRWKWSRNKVRKFLKDLEKEQQIEQHKSNITQIVTIVNYDLYQYSEQQPEHQKNTKKASEGHQTDTNKNVKKEKNEETKAIALNQKQKTFYDSLIPFISEFGKDTIREFYNYWSEPNRSKTKIKWELQATWDTGKRLLRWNNRDSKSKQPVNKTPIRKPEDW